MGDRRERKNEIRVGILREIVFAMVGCLPHNRKYDREYE